MCLRALFLSLLLLWAAQLGACPSLTWDYLWGLPGPLFLIWLLWFIEWREGYPLLRAISIKVEDSIFFSQSCLLCPSIICTLWKSPRASSNRLRESRGNVYGDATMILLDNHLLLGTWFADL